MEVKQNLLLILSSPLLFSEWLILWVAAIKGVIITVDYALYEEFGCYYQEKLVAKCE